VFWRKFKLDWSYAVGELIIVTLGVLVALGINQWQQDLDDRELELEYVERLIQDLTLDIAAVSSIMTETEARAGYGRIVLAAYDSKRRANSPTDFVRAVEFGNYFSYPSYSTATIDDLMSTGNLRLIENPELKEVISRYYSTIKWTEQFRELYRPTQLTLLLLIPEFLKLDLRYALFQEGIVVSCGPTLSCDRGIPWAPTKLVVTEVEGDRVLERLLSRPEARPLYANMARIQGNHFANLANIRGLAEDALLVLEQYSQLGR
jgi:hypothetical protein